MNPEREESKSVPRFFRNAISLLTGDVLNKATTFVIYALVSRFLGVREFGQLSLGLLLFYLFQVVATAGIPNLLTREIAQKPRRSSKLTSVSLSAAMIVSLAAIIAMVGLTFIFAYDTDTTLVISILALGLLPYSMALIFEASFRGNEQMHLIAFSNFFANVVKVVGGVALLQLGYGIYALAWLLVAMRCLIFAIDMALYLWVLQGTWHWAGWFRIMALIRRTATFFWIDVVLAFWSSLNALILSKLMTEVEVGLFSAASQLLQPVLLVNRSLVGSIFPSMCSTAKSELTRLADMTRWMVAFLMILGMPVMVLIAAYSDLILSLAYRATEFQRAVPLLQIGAAALVCQCFTSILGHALWATDQERRTLRMVVIGVALSIPIGVLAIYNFGMIGASLAGLAVSWIMVLQHFLGCRAALGRSPLDQQILIPTIATVAMIATMWLGWTHNRYGATALGLMVYLLTVGILLTIQHGGVANLRQRFFSPLVG